MSDVERCPDGKCIAGLISGEIINEENWAKNLLSFHNELKNFKSSKKAISHPGFVHRFKYCTSCGRKLETIIRNPLP